MVSQFGRSARLVCESQSDTYDSSCNIGTSWQYCLYSLLTTSGGVPYADLSNKVVVKSVLAGYHLERPANCSDEM